MKKVTLFSAFLGTLIEVYDFTVFPLLIPILSEVFFLLRKKVLLLVLLFWRMLSVMLLNL